MRLLQSMKNRFRNDGHRAEYNHELHEVSGQVVEGQQFCFSIIEWSSTGLD